MSFFSQIFFNYSLTHPPRIPLKSRLLYTGHLDQYFSIESWHTLVVYHGKSLPMLNLLSKYQFQIFQYFSKFPICFPNFQKFSKFPNFSKFPVSFSNFRFFFQIFNFCPNFQMFPNFQICFFFKF